VFRDLKQVVEDAAIDAALLEYAKSKGYNKFDAGGFDLPRAREIPAARPPSSSISPRI